LRPLLEIWLCFFDHLLLILAKEASAVIAVFLAKASAVIHLLGCSFCCIANIIGIAVFEDHLLLF
jgi:hypothetical protein